MKRNKMICMTAALAAVVLGAATFAGCGSSSYSESYAVNSYKDSYATEDAAGSGYSSSASYASEDYYSMEEADYTDETADYSENLDGGSADFTVDADSTISQKLIVTWDLTMETEKYDDAVEEIRDSVKAAGGYIESENESSYYDCNRYEYLTIRIPEDKAEEWVNGVSEYGTIVSRSKNTEDATLEYVDTESRLKALRTEQETLMNMMEKAEDISDLITIESELTEVNSEIEALESQLRVLDNRVNYTTVYMSIDEVNRESVEPQTFGEEIKETFLNSMYRLKVFAKNLLVGIIGNSVIIIIVVAIIAAVIFAIRKIRRHHKNVKEEKKAKKNAVNVSNVDDQNTEDNQN